MSESLSFKVVDDDVKVDVIFPDSVVNGLTNWSDEGRIVGEDEEMIIGDFSVAVAAIIESVVDTFRLRTIQDCNGCLLDVDGSVGGGSIVPSATFSSIEVALLTSFSTSDATQREGECEC